MKGRIEHDEEPALYAVLLSACACVLVLSATPTDAIQLMTAGGEVVPQHLKRKKKFGPAAKKLAKKYGPAAKKISRLAGPAGRILDAYSSGQTVGEKLNTYVLDPLTSAYYDKKQEELTQRLEQDIAEYKWQLEETSGSAELRSERNESVRRKRNTKISSVRGGLTVTQRVCPTPVLRQRQAAGQPPTKSSRQTQDARSFSREIHAR